MADHRRQARDYESITQGLRLGGAPGHVPAWVAQTHAAAAEDLAAEARLLDAIERHELTGYRFVVRRCSEVPVEASGESGYCVIDTDEHVDVLGPVTYQEASRRRDELIDAAIEEMKDASVGLPMHLRTSPYQDKRHLRYDGPSGWVQEEVERRC